ncbi:murein biosynthesis integral membrane protein MurJ [Rhodoferax sp.]|uniref:murein biosynthesis integral membrane protein MurJ n=1 Tax=Rhodoferax sp. TaxID=50421 RepID=UPI002754AE6A|nr:murein biosynthesis integral membrane protein MurJ [Rhodoferax sp.]
MTLLKSAATVSLLTLASRVTGLVRDLLIASTFGATAMTDAFHVAFRIPNMFRRLFAEGAFSQAFVPTLGISRTQQGDDATKLLIDRVATVLAWVLVLTCLLGVLGAPVLVWAMASGLKQDPRGLEAAIVMTRWMFPYLGLISLAGLCGGVLNTWRRFALPAAAPVLLNLSMIGAAWLGAPWFKSLGLEPIYALGGGVMLGGLLQLGLQLPVLHRMGLLPSIGLRWRAVKAAWQDPATKRVAKLMVPALFGVGVAQISLLINTQYASYMTPGSVTWLSNADRLMEFPTALLGVALGVVLMPRLASAKASEDVDQYSAMLDWGLRLVVLLAVPCAVALLTFSLPLVATIFQHGAYTAEHAYQTSLALTGYGVGLIGMVAIKVLAPGYYASQDIRTPVRIAMVVLLITQLFNLMLVPRLAHAGLALAIGLGALINAVWLAIGLIRRGSYHPRPGWGLFVLQVLAASALLAVFLMWAASAVSWTQMASESWKRVGLLGLVLLASAAIYFSAIWASGLKLRRLLKP